MSGRWVLLLLLAGCPVTERAALRTSAANRLDGCVREYPRDIKRCLQESAEWCKAHGLEASCGTDDSWTRWPR